MCLRRILCGIALAMAASARAEDLYPPSWDRYAADTEYCAWEFDPDDYFSPEPGAFGRCPFFAGVELGLPEYEGRQGVIPMSNLLMELPGLYPTDPYENVIVQLVTYDSRIDFVPEPQFEIGFFWSEFPGTWTANHTHAIPLAEPGWRYDRFDIEMTGWATWDRVWLLVFLSDSDDAIFIDQIVYDALLPEPGSLLLWAFASLVILRRRRRPGCCVHRGC